MQPSLRIGGFTSALEAGKTGAMRTVTQHMGKLQPRVRYRPAQHYPISRWQSWAEKQSLLSKWTFKLNLAIHLSHCGHCVKFFGYYIKNPFLGNVMQLV